MVPAGPRLRTLDLVLRRHLAEHRQMAFVSGPRQVGKTTTCRALASPDAYLDWDNADDRKVFAAGEAALAERLGLSRLQERPRVATFDELHKYRHWKRLLKGFFDVYGDRVRLLVTGSARLDVFRRGGDSLMGRYFRHRMHPFGIGELIDPEPFDTLVRPPRVLADEELDALWRYGGFPEPFLRRDTRFSNRWQGLRRQQLVREDVRDLTRIQELSQIEALVELLEANSGTALVYSRLSNELRTSVDSVRRWIGVLAGLHHGFLLRPYTKNVAKTLRKEPKWYVRDWSLVADPGRRVETFVACHLLKAVEHWEDEGLGKFELQYLRDKNQREVDFVVVRDRKPWFLVEVKASDTEPSPSLAYFARTLKVPHALQAVFDLPFVNADCFAERRPTVVPLRTLLSQLP